MDWTDEEELALILIVLEKQNRGDVKRGNPHLSVWITIVEQWTRVTGKDRTAKQIYNKYKRCKQQWGA